MKKQIVGLMPYLIILAIDFYLLPFLARNTGMAMLIMLCVMPVIALITALMYGVRQGFNIFLPLASFILFLPTVFIHYNSSAWIYAFFYAGLVLLGNCIGRTFYMKS